MTSWQRLGAVAPADLVDARLQTHWAAQIVAALGFTLVEAEPDESHSNMSWRSPNYLTGHYTSRSPSVRLGLAVDTLRLDLFDLEGDIVESIDLNGRTLNDGYEWLGRVLSDLLADPIALTRPDHELPHHPVADGAPFAIAAAHSPELAGWFGNAHAALRDVGETNTGASPIRCWPHHFDIATLITVEAAEDPHNARTIGVGMTPGDGGYPEPYWYVTPWPYPDNPTPADLDGGGHWHTEGWFGAVLRGSSIAADADAGAQAERTRRFLESAIRESLRLLS